MILAIESPSDIRTAMSGLLASILYSPFTFFLNRAAAQLAESAK